MFHQSQCTRWFPIQGGSVTGWVLENSLYKKGGPSLPPLDGKCNSRNININMTTTDVCFSVDCLFRKQTRSELFVVKGDCNNNFSVVVCRKILSPPRRFKVKDLICDTSQIFLRNNAFIFFQKSDTLFLHKPGPSLN